MRFVVNSTDYEHPSVIVTTNMALKKWTEVFGNEQLVGASLDRLPHHCNILKATGESYQLKDTKRRQRKSTACKKGVGTRHEFGQWVNATPVSQQAFTKGLGM